MARLTGSYGRPIQGISQQPDIIKAEGQCRDSLNCVPDVIDGLRRRQGTQTEYELFAGTLSPQAYKYSYFRDNNEAYVIIIEPNDIPRIYSLYTGREQFLTVEGSASNYISSDNPLDSLRIHTISDFNFIVNREVAPKLLDTEEPDTNNNTAICEVQFATYGRTYEIWANNIKIASHKTPIGDVASHIDQVDTAYVAAQLESKISTTFYDVQRFANTLFIRRLNNLPITLETVDGADGGDLTAIVDKVDNIAKLPSRAPDGFKVKVQLKGSSEDSHYYLKAVASESVDQTVTWRETVETGSMNQLDKSTMPHVLVRESVNPSGLANFVLREGEWEDRRVGNDNTNPHPSFINEDFETPILNIGTFQNRLVFESSNGVMMTRSNKFFDFYRLTSQVTRDDDPIAAYPDSDYVPNMTRHSFLNGDIIFWSDSEQFAIDGSETRTTANTVIKKVSSYDSDSDITPVGVGSSLLYPVVTGSYTQIREYSTTEDPDIRASRSLTEHVLQLIEGRIKQIVAIPSADMALFITKENLIYAYNWKDLDRERVQSAWGRWELKDVTDIIHVTVRDTLLYWIIERNGRVYLETMKVDVDIPTDTLGYQLKLDRVAKVTATRNNSFGWDIEFPYPIRSGIDDSMVVVIAEGGYPEEIGAAVNFSRVESKYVTTDDLGAGDEVEVYIGVNFKSLYNPATPNPRDAQGRSRDIERFQLAKMFLNYEQTGEITFTVTNSFSGRTREVTHNGRRIGQRTNIVGFAPMVSGTWPIAIRQEAKYLNMVFFTESHLPFNIRDIEYEATHAIRGRRY